MNTPGLIKKQASCLYRFPHCSSYWGPVRAFEKTTGLKVLSICVDPDEWRVLDNTDMLETMAAVVSQPRSRSRSREDGKVRRQEAGIAKRGEWAKMPLLLSYIIFHHPATPLGNFSSRRTRDFTGGEICGECGQLHPSLPLAALGNLWVAKDGT